MFEHYIFILYNLSQLNNPNYNNLVRFDPQELIENTLKEAYEQTNRLSFKIVRELMPTFRWHTPKHSINKTKICLFTSNNIKLDNFYLELSFGIISCSGTMLKIKNIPRIQNISLDEFHDDLDLLIKTIRDNRTDCLDISI